MIEVFDHLPDGSAVHRVTLKNDELTARFLTYGAVLQDLRLHGHAKSLTLGYGTLGEYLCSSDYLGATVGRCANRIGNARFVLDGDTFELDANDQGKHHLHGGSDGTSNRMWRICDHGPDFVTMTQVVPDGHMGYPGELTIEATFRLDGTALDIRYRAKSTRPTLCNIAHHSYWVLDNSGTILDHDLFVGTREFTSVDEALIPTGAVDETGGGHPFFYPQAAPVRSWSKFKTLDHNFCFAPERAPTIPNPPLATLESRASGLRLRVRSTEPGLQVYDSGPMDNPGLDIDGRALRGHPGLALEPQNWPDAINHDGFPNAVLRPGETYNQHTRFEIERMA